MFVTSGYEAGSMMVRVEKGAAGFSAVKLFDLRSQQFNSEVHTPVLHQGRMFGVGKMGKGRFTCLDLDGKKVWESPLGITFGLGSFLLADGMFFVLEGDTGKLRLIEASTGGYKELASAQVLEGEDVWGPMALSEGKLVLRDMGKMGRIQVGGAAGQAPAPSALAPAAGSPLIGAR